ncbi:putative Helicase with SNF2 domain [Desulfamplus magnetovallimortis]|uniref:Putative Helicase with SNF2 domain n=1 Tax=Desulfamplus magnetovallimortis TaxID=1246637 RepID=A0A1W1H8G9_9BACT|nr:DEAD/DEAH box helicase [Desulfamplus magnetovallimortis]SLM28777.1 putative Helicase with SNF2 domain [Desulfamplus magnetovallimortis]
MILVYIFYDDKIIIEVQENRPRLSPFIRTKSRLTNLSAKLIKEYDRTVLSFLELSGQENPPFEIHEKFFCKELISIIQNSEFTFTKEGKHSSLKKNTRLSDLKKSLPVINCIVEPHHIEIRIKNIYKNGVKASIFTNIHESIKLIPINYDFIVPLNEKAKLCYVSEVEKELLLKELEKYFPTNTHLKENLLFIPYDALKKIAFNEKIHVKYYDNKEKKSKSISFASDSLFRIRIFPNNVMKDSDIQLYSSLLNSYLEGKRYIEWNDSVILFGNEDVISQFDEKTISYSLDRENINASCNIFFKKLWGLTQQIEKDNISQLLKNSNFCGELKVYQIEGIHWLLNLYHNKIDGGLLADEMGLGKTVQLIAFLSILSPQKTLIIAPATIINNWAEEIRKFNPKFYKSLSLEPTDIKKITILSYETVRNKIDELSNHKFDISVLDESQKIKNVNTKLFYSINKIARNFTIIMTGTPIENGLSDFWSMFITINSGLQVIFDSKIKPMLKDKSSYKKAVEFTGKIFYPLIIQRRKKDVLSLPERNNHTILIEFTKAERMAYNQIIEIFKSAISTGLSGRIQHIALEALLRLRQYCSLHEMLPSSLLANCPNLKESKIDSIIKLTQEIINRGEKVVIFSQFLPTLDRLQYELISKKYYLVRLDGATQKKERAKIINEFQSNNTCSIFLISLKAGGTGINLTKAVNSILVEPWWNPAVEEQAFARIHRIGQSHTVNTYRLFYSNTIETDIAELINHKSNISKTMNNTLSSIDSNSIHIDLAKKIFNEL